jgi:hypothetical protein
LVEQNTIGIAVPLLVVVFWLCLLFLSFGLFAPRNATAILALFLCALAVAGAIEMTQGPECAFPGNHPDLQQADERRPRPNQLKSEADTIKGDLLTLLQA